MTTDPVVVRAGVAAAALLAWFAVGAPALAEAVRAGRVEALRVPGIGELRGHLAAHPERATPDVLATLAEAEAATDRAQRWSRTVGALVTPAQIAEGRRLATALPPASPGERKVVEPEALALAEALIDRYGWAPPASPTPAAPAGADPLAGVSRNDAARALRALALGPGLPPDVAHAVLSATLDLLDAQAEGSAAEAEVWAAIRER